MMAERGVDLAHTTMRRFKRFRNASITITSIELMHGIRKSQFALGKLRAKGCARDLECGRCSLISVESSNRYSQRFF